jgi:hypothetical protein
MTTCINNQLNIFIMNKVILSISAMLLVGSVCCSKQCKYSESKNGYCKCLVVQAGLSNVSDVSTKRNDQYFG